MQDVYWLVYLVGIGNILLALAMQSIIKMNKYTQPL